MSGVSDLLDELLNIEQQLLTALKPNGQKAGSSFPAGAEVLSCPETLAQLKNTMDRIRPLLWIYAKRVQPPQPLGL